MPDFSPVPLPDMRTARPPARVSPTVPRVEEVVAEPKVGKGEVPGCLGPVFKARGRWPRARGRKLADLGNEEGVALVDLFPSGSPSVVV